MKEIRWRPPFCREQKIGLHWNERAKNRAQSNLYWNWLLLGLSLHFWRLVFQILLGERRYCRWNERGNSQASGNCNLPLSISTIPVDHSWIRLLLLKIKVQTLINNSQVLCECSLHELRYRSKRQTAKTLSCCHNDFPYLVPTTTYFGNWKAHCEEPW